MKLILLDEDAQYNIFYYSLWYQTTSQTMEEDILQSYFSSTVF